MAEAQALDDVATAFDLEDSDEDGKSKTDAEASLERNEQTQPKEVIDVVPEESDGAAKSSCSCRGEEEGEAGRLTGLRNLAYAACCVQSIGAPG